LPKNGDCRLSTFVYTYTGNFDIIVTIPPTRIFCQSVPGGIALQDQNKTISVTEEQFVGSITVIQRNDIVITGKISHIEGDLIELEVTIPEANQLVLGSEVKLVIYTSYGIMNFMTSLFAKEYGTLLFLVPQEIQSLFLKKRAFPRFEVNQNAFLYQKPDTEPLLEVLVNNVGLGGIGFTVDTAIPLPSYKKMYVDMNFENKILLGIEIIHSKPAEIGQYYGVKFVDLSPKTMNSLRAYILMRQVHHRVEAKRNKLLS
jgi:c-di-GMP-binding flagellar brake protein YcgR